MKGTVWRTRCGRELLAVGLLLAGMLLFGLVRWEQDRGKAIFFDSSYEQVIPLTWETGELTGREIISAFYDHETRTYEVRLRLPGRDGNVYWPFGAEEHPILTVDDRQVEDYLTVPHTTIWGKDVYLLFSDVELAPEAVITVGEEQCTLCPVEE
ncbi:hypothetical protein [Pseudoflavonifractor sp. MCC625]|uniref:hypothetical protein n=1 Tax=Pseudoflavonifractor sp. MCC625 TaxID=2592647 RepID=UPI001C0248FF|nr:hypothetical protein [Pseudoflavonifractor sp. MCC625]MBT9683579.1 hypothetical protein [Pseudoflavonifractor sp. MCC625]